MPAAAVGASTFSPIEAALASHRTTDHFKKYQATTAKMVVGRNARALTGVAFNYKAR